MLHSLRKKIYLSSLSAVVMLQSSLAFAGGAGGGGQDLAKVATTITSNFKDVSKLITAGGFIAGLGFAISAILKFHAHKNNPQQIPIGTPIALLFISAALIFLPNIFTIAGHTIFGTDLNPGTYKGVAVDIQ